MLWIPIDRSQDISLIRQVYEQLRTKILQGDLKTGEKLPSSRVLASELNVSRNVILEAYEQLTAEGFIETHQGSGTFIAQGTYLEQAENETTLMLNEPMKDKDIIDFRSGVPALDLFPRDKWGQLAKRVSLETSHSIFGYDSPEGRIELRSVLSRYLLRTRGVRCHPSQLVITSGATQALSLVAKLLLTKNDEVIIEDPITHEIQTIFQSYGGSLLPIPVDEHGMKTNLLPSNKKPNFIFVTPSHQFPMGGTLPIQRRIQLIEFARKKECYIVEDDYDSEFRYEGPPVSSLQGLDPNRTIYIGTFSKILSPALRLGYLILPPSLVQRCRDLKWFSDLHTPSLEQLTLAHFIEEGYLEKHVFKMKKIYQKRRDALKEGLINLFKNKVEFFGDSTGLHFVAKFNGVNFTDNVLSNIQENKVKVYPIELHTIKKRVYTDSIILGFGNLNENQIEEGVHRLKEGLNT